MPETPHIKRFEEYEEYAGIFTSTRAQPDTRVEHMLNDLAEHVERLEARISTIEYNLNMVPPDPTQDGNHTL